MSGTTILDADMATVAAWTRSGFAWWIDELRSLVPPAVRRRFDPQPAVVARYCDERITLHRRGAVIQRGDGAMAVALHLPADAAFIREVKLPVLGSADLRRLIALDSDRLLPFAPGTALVDFEAGPAADGKQSVVIAGLPRKTAAAALAAADADGLDVQQMRIASDAQPRFDFLPDWRSDSAGAADRPQLLWWSFVGALFIVNLAVMIVRDVQQLRAVEALVAEHGQSAATARQLRARVLAEDQCRRELIAHRERQSPQPALAAATRALPDTVWVQRFVWDGTELRLIGFKPGSFDIVAALRRSPAFDAVRSVAVEMPEQASVTQPFEVTARHRS
jgi:general secretion pathway protein L